MSHQDGYEIGYEQIERQTGLGRYAINEAIKNLSSLGWLLVERPKLPNGQFTNKTWTILNPYDESTVGNSTMEQPQVGESTDNRRTLIREEQVKEDSFAHESEQRFDLFWSNYPNKVDKAKAKRRFLKLAESEQVEAIAGAARYRDDPNREDAFTKYPLTWLVAESWLNGPLPVRVKRGPVDKQAENAKALEEFLRMQEGNK